MAEVWAPLLGYPGYSASNYGRIRNDKRLLVLTHTALRDHRPFVKLSLHGEQVTRNVSKLVCDAFISPNRDWDTPIHLDGNLWNCHVDNMEWRPRWFAIKHTQQFRRRQPVYKKPVRELDSGWIYENVWEPVLQFGLLYMGLIIAIHNETRVFPSMQKYEWVE
jgi:hypothetical protein